MGGANSTELNETLVEPHTVPDEVWADEDTAWDYIHAQKKKIIFDDVKIAPDGGLSDIGDPKLWYNSRYVGATITIIFVFYNLYYLIKVDVGVITDRFANGKSTNHNYLLSYWILEKITSGHCPIHPPTLIAILELVCLLCFIIATVKDVYVGLFKHGHPKWKAISEIFWIDLPKLSVFSSMRLLGYIVPQKLSYDIFFAIFYEPGSKGFNLLKVLVSRPIFLLIGMDCFLVKYRLASTFIIKDEVSWNDFVGVVVFVNQVLGVVDLNNTIKSRLYRFVFAGEDGVMTEEETCRQKVWEAFVAFQIFEKYTRLKACVLMLSWCDDDFQLLCLDPAYATEKKHMKK